MQAMKPRLLASAALLFATPAFAQDEDIVVTGIRGSIQSSLDAKRKATSIVEVISAEDIGLLPDLSIADTLARIPDYKITKVDDLLPWKWKR